jgi:hypothetical protein
MTRGWISTIALIVAVALAPLPLLARDSLPASWDNLVKVDSKRFAGVYVLPGADFRVYNKVMFDPTQVAFDKNWKRDYNNTSMSMSMRITDADIRKAADRAGSAFGEVLAKAFGDAGYQVVTAPGADVLRVSTAVINLKVTAPDLMTAGRTRSYADYAGQATVVLEARDSMTGAILGRAVDAKAAGDTSPMLMRNRSTNARDFKRLFQNWAEASTRGLATLKSMSPIPAVPVRAGE